MPSHDTHHTQPLKKNRERARRTPQIRRNAVHPGTGIGESHDAYVHTDRKSCMTGGSEYGYGDTRTAPQAGAEAPSRGTKPEMVLALVWSCVLLPSSGSRAGRFLASGISLGRRWRTQEARTMACCTSPCTPHSGEGEGAAALESGAEDAKFATGVTPTSRRCRMRRRRSSEYGAVSISGKSDHWRSG